MTQIKTELLKKALEAQKLTPEAAAEKIGVTPATLRRIIRTGDCGGIHIGKVARFLGVPVWELVK